MNRLAVIILNKDIERKVSQQLIDNNFRFTRINSSGGYLRKRNLTFLVGINKTQLKKLVQLIEAVAKKRSSLIGSDLGAPLSAEAGMPGLPPSAAPIRVGGATVFVLPVEESYNF